MAPFCNARKKPERTEDIVEVVGIGTVVVVVVVVVAGVVVVVVVAVVLPAVVFCLWSLLSFVLTFLFGKSSPAWNANVKQFHSNQQTMTLGANVKNGTEFTIPKRKPLVVAKIADHINLYGETSENGGFSPQIIHFNRVFHYKQPSIFGISRYPI